MSEAKPAQPTMTTKSVMNQQVRTVSQPSVADAETSADWAPVPGVPAEDSPLMKTATSAEVELLNSIGEDFMNEAIVARSLILPSYLDVKFKDPTLHPRWVNFKGGEGRQLFFAKGFGFTNATLEDLATELDASMIKNQDGGLICGDLILMKVNKLKLFQKYKSNVLRANVMAGTATAQAFDKAQSTFDNGELSPGEVNYARGKNATGGRPRVEFFKP